MILALEGAKGLRLRGDVQTDRREQSMLQSGGLESTDRTRLKTQKERLNDQAPLRSRWERLGSEGMKQISLRQEEGPSFA